MADVACFCGCCFSFVGTVGACPECGEGVTLTTVPPFAAHGTAGAESVCVVDWNGPSSADRPGWGPPRAGVNHRAASSVGARSSM
jgi:hypothetical protein